MKNSIQLKLCIVSNSVKHYESKVNRKLNCLLVLSLKFRDLGDRDWPGYSSVINLTLVLAVVSQSCCVITTMGMFRCNSAPFETPEKKKVLKF